MDENRSFDKVTGHNTEFLTDGSRIYTFEFEDGVEKHFILPVDKIREFLKKSYEDAYANGEVFDTNQFEEKRSEYIAKNIDK